MDDSERALLSRAVDFGGPDWRAIADGLAEALRLFKMKEKSLIAANAGDFIVRIPADAFSVKAKALAAYEEAAK